MTTASYRSRFSGSPLAGNLAVGHALASIVFLSWWFGGMETRGREIATMIGALSPIITIIAWRSATADVRRRFLRFAIPLALLATVCIVGLFNQNTRVLTADGEDIGIVPRDDYIRFLPSNAWPPNAVADLLLNSFVILTAINLFLAAPPRPAQRFLLAGIAINGGVLAAAGTAFKLTGAQAIFGTFPSPNRNFFASFYYYNHWGAFAILGAAASAGLAIDFLRYSRDRPWRHTPGPFFAALTLVLLMSVPMAGGRASTIAALLLTAVVALRFAGQTRSKRTSSARRFAFGAMLVALACAASAWVARDSIKFALQKSTQQLSTVRNGGLADPRLTVYRETWLLFREKPTYGWGWHSFRYAFRRVQSQDFKQQNEQKVKSVFLNAHNDWLRLLAELGTVGAALSIATLAGVARAASFGWWKLAPSAELVAGFGCVGVLACVDFPFACPAVVITAWALLSIAAGVASDREAQASTP